MRKAQKEQVQDWIVLLNRANGEIEKAIESENTQAALHLLKQCQEAAIHLGELIEQAEGEGVVTVSFLEDYCECIYQIHETLEQYQGIDGKVAYKKLCDSLAQVEYSVQKDISMRREIVFLSYKASTWEMFEDFWQAAKDDLNCDVYVIPIPYYYKNWDGSLREMQYEIAQYPKDVPVIPYNEFNFEKHCPDVIFIQNPYDEYNNTTSVHPYFYSNNLKNYTENLVYIPYFTLAEIDPEDKRAVDSMEHFVMMPGVVNADKVIVQSEAMRQSYIEYLSKHMGEDHRAEWEEKIIVPDLLQLKEMQNSQRKNSEDYVGEIPEKWQKLIQKPDGTRKKVIFYFTSISTLFQYGETMLEKLHDTFNIFKENQDDLVLLWKPDLLIEKNNQCFSAKIWESYQKITKDYKQEDWGIYDDAQDADMAVACSDAYYGDGGSLTREFYRMNKPVMIQDIKVKTKAELSKLADI
ncbi:MAG: hypothetical protein NC094_11915 [Bacteroidales bacterium]|nr:hypothetical protein [Lachnoclostridium sp.]MCM1385200.1 hypothetical protein [Lachnoclostridium sp.]MCM1466115.1 hypothetical protein [Bacteroidales bacterium]